MIDGKAGSVDARRSKIAHAVNTIAEGKKWVLVDGVGYAAVGSVAGVSNAEVASLLNAPVLVVGRPGIGNAIDSMNFILAYFALNKVHCIGACWNKLPKQSTYHSYESCKQYVNKYFRETKPGVISTYGHIPLVARKVSGKDRDRVLLWEGGRLRTLRVGEGRASPLQLEAAVGVVPMCSLSLGVRTRSRAWAVSHCMSLIVASCPLSRCAFVVQGDSAAAPGSGSATSPPAEEVVCRLRAAKTDLVMTSAEEVWLREFLAIMEREFDMEGMLRDLNLYYSTHRVQLVSVV